VGDFQSGMLASSSLTFFFQLGQRSTHQSVRGGQEDHEAFQHSCPLQAHVSRIEATEASPSRERNRWNFVRTWEKTTDLSKVISLSDIFISPLEDMWEDLCALANAE